MGIEVEEMNKLVKIRDSLYYRINKSECLCEDYKEDLEITFEELENFIDTTEKNEDE